MKLQEVTESLKQAVQYLEPNLDVEWKEAERYPELAELGLEGWKALKGQQVNVTQLGGLKRIGNTEGTDVNTAKRAIANLEPEKVRRMQQAIKAGVVELPIIAKFHSGEFDLVAGNTRFTGLVANGILPEVYYIDLTTQLNENTFKQGRIAYITQTHAEKRGHEREITDRHALLPKVFANAQASSHWANFLTKNYDQLIPRQETHKFWIYDPKTRISLLMGRADIATSSGIDYRFAVITMHKGRPYQRFTPGKEKGHKFSNRSSTTGVPKAVTLPRDTRYEILDLQKGWLSQYNPDTKTKKPTAPKPEIGPTPTEMSPDEEEKAWKDWQKDHPDDVNEADYPIPYDSTKPNKKEPGKEVAQTTQPKTIKRRDFMRKARDVATAALNPDAVAQLAKLAIGSEPAPSLMPHPGPVPNVTDPIPGYGPEQPAIFLHKAYSEVYQYVDKLGDEALEVLDIMAPQFADAMNEPSVDWDFEKLVKQFPHKRQEFWSDLDQVKDALAGLVPGTKKTITDLQVGARDIKIIPKATKFVPGKMHLSKRESVQSDGVTEAKGVPRGFGGNCYEAGGRHLMALFGKGNRTAELVHADITPKIGRLTGVTYGHCWIEDGDTVNDVSDNHRTDIHGVLGDRKDVWYGVTDPKNIKRYDFKALAKMVTKHKHWGPWETTSVNERPLSQDEKDKKEKNVKGMKKNKKDFEKRYGKDAEAVMYATATKMAKENVVTEGIDSYGTAYHWAIHAFKEFIDSETDWNNDPNNLFFDPKKPDADPDIGVVVTWNPGEKHIVSYHSSGRTPHGVESAELHITPEKDYRPHGDVSDILGAIENGQFVNVVLQSKDNKTTNPKVNEFLDTNFKDNTPQQPKKGRLVTKDGVDITDQLPYKTVDFRGDPIVIVDFEAPHKPSSTGRIITDKGRSFFPGVADLKIIGHNFSESGPNENPKTMKRRAFLKKAGQYASAALNPDVVAQLAQLAPLMPKSTKPAPAPAFEPRPRTGKAPLTGTRDWVIHTAGLLRQAYSKVYQFTDTMDDEALEVMNDMAPEFGDAMDKADWDFKELVRTNSIAKVKRFLNALEEVEGELISLSTGLRSDEPRNLGYGPRNEGTFIDQFEPEYSEKKRELANKLRKKLGLDLKPELDWQLELANKMQKAKWVEQFKDLEKEFNEGEVIDFPGTYQKREYVKINGVTLLKDVWGYMSNDRSEDHGVDKRGRVSHKRLTNFTGNEEPKILLMAYKEELKRFIDQFTQAGLESDTGVYKKELKDKFNIIYTEDVNEAIKPPTGWISHFAVGKLIGNELGDNAEDFWTSIELKSDDDLMRYEYGSTAANTYLIAEINRDVDRINTWLSKFPKHFHFKISERVPDPATGEMGPGLRYIDKEEGDIPEDTSYIQWHVEPVQILVNGLTLSEYGAMADLSKMWSRPVGSQQHLLRKKKKKKKLKEQEPTPTPTPTLISKYLYHVTFKSNISNIKEKGLEQFHTSLWVKGPGGQRYNKQAGIFAFDHPLDAVGWAQKMEWEFRDDIIPNTDNDIAIIRLDMQDGEEIWGDDPSDDMMLARHGKSLRSSYNISADKIIDVFNMGQFGKAGDLKPRKDISSRDQWLSQVHQKLVA